MVSIVITSRVHLRSGPFLLLPLLLTQRRSPLVISLAFLLSFYPDLDAAYRTLSFALSSLTLQPFQCGGFSQGISVLLIGLSFGGNVSFLPLRATYNFYWRKTAGEISFMGV